MDMDEQLRALLDEHPAARLNFVDGKDDTRHGYVGDVGFEEDDGGGMIEIVVAFTS